MSPSLLDTRLDYHRALVASALPDRATRRRPVRIPDGSGGFTDGPPDLSLTFPCRLYGHARTPLEQPEAGRVVAVMQWSLAAPHGTDLQPTDEVLIAARTFEVIDDADDRSSATLMWVNLREVR